MPNLDDRYAPKDRSEAMIEYESGTLIALAGPGTGKTWALLKRVRELVLNRGVDPASIAYITFIREITRKFEQELRDEFKDEGFAPSIRISTLHGLALGLIRNQGKLIGRVGHHEPLRVDDDGLLERILQEDMQCLLAAAGTKLSSGDVVQGLKKAKQQWQGGIKDSHVSLPNAMVLDAFRQLARAYELLDWDQLVVCANEICDTLPSLPRWLGGISHFLVDEYQDFNPAERIFLDHIMSNAESAVIAGDDDQSLYRWRGADPTGIVELDAEEGLDHVSLVYSWRCRSRIVEAANCFLRWMRRDLRQLRAVRRGGRVQVRCFKSAKAEAEFLAKRIRTLLHSIPPGAPRREGVACLFCCGKALHAYKRVLEDRGIHCTVPKMAELSDTQERVRAALRLAYLGGQPLLERAMLSLFPSLTSSLRRDLITAALKYDCSVPNAVAQCVDRPHWPDDASLAAEEYQLFIQALTCGDAGEVAKCINRVTGVEAECGPETIERFLAEADSGLEEAADRAVERLFDVAALTARDFVSEAVELYTMHGAKGLTRRHVILPGCEERWLPGEAEDADLEERKRLFYVAVTRATKSLLITHPWSRVTRGARTDPLSWGQGKNREISSFARRLSVPIQSARWSRAHEEC